MNNSQQPKYLNAQLCKSLLDISTDIYFVYLPNDCIITVSEQFCKLFGYSKDEICGQSLKTILKNKENIKFLSVLNAILAKRDENHTIFVDFTTKQGNIIPVELLTTIYFDELEKQNLILCKVTPHENNNKKSQEENKNRSLEWNAIFNAIEHPAVLLNPFHKIIDANKSTLLLTNKTKEELIDLRCYEVFHDKHSICAPNQCPLDKLLISNKSETFKMEMESYGSSYIVSCSPVFDENHNLTSIVHIATDVSELKESEIIIQEKNRQLEMLTEASKTINTTLDIEIIIQSLVQNAIGIIGAYGGSAGILVDDKIEFNKYYTKTDSFTIDYKFPRGHGIPGWVFEHRKPYITNIATKDENVIKEIQSALNFAKLVNIPIIDKKGELLGCFEIHNLEQGANFTENDIKILESLAASAAIAIQNFKLIERDNSVRDFLEENERKLTTLISNLPGIAYRVRIHPDWAMEYISSGIFKITGYHPEDFTSNAKITYIDLLSEEDREWTQKSVQFAIQHKSHYMMEYSIVDAYGKRKWLWDKGTAIYDKKGIPIALEGFITDITERKNTEEQLKESESKYRLLIENQNDLIVKIDLDNKFTYVSNTYCKLFGKSEADLLGKSFVPLVHDDDSETTLKAMEQLKKPPYTCVLEQRALTAKGWRWLEWSDKAILNNNKEIVEIVGVGRDIHEKKKLEEELIKAKEKAEESDRLKSTFLTNISHELRTPMNGIIGFTGLMTNNNLSEQKREEYADLIYNAGKQLLNIINDLIDISRIETNQVTFHNNIFDINSVTSDMVKFYQPLAESKNITVKFVKPSVTDNPQLNSDVQKFRQIFTNLIGNAIKFTPENGTITVGYVVNHDQYEFYVTDTGIGIEKKHHEVIFDRFRQANDSYDPKFGGSGLGLAITKKYIQMMGGEIWVESEFKKGSTFKFKLPVNIEKAESTSNAHPTEQYVRLDGISVLIADDEPVNIQLLQAILLKHQIKTYIAVNGQEVVDICNKIHPDMILMDIKMPVMNGVEAMHEIRKKHPHTPIIACTAYAQIGDKEKMLSEGFNGYISKPIDKETLLTEITKRLHVQS